MILLDTHVLIWWIEGSKDLSQKARRVIDEEVTLGRAHVSAISVWEIAMLVKKGRLKLTLPVESWLEKVLVLKEVEVVSVDWRIALRAVQLIDFENTDPVDRLIVATAVEMGLDLVTKDKKIASSKLVRAVW